MREMMGTIAAIFIIMLLLPMFARYQQQGMDNVKKRQAADHLAEVNHAVAEYVRGNYETLLDQAAPTSGPEIGVADLVAGGHLPTGLSDRNVWGQQYRAYVRKPQDDTLEAVTLTLGGSTAGRMFTTTLIPSAAALLGGAGGFVPSGLIPGQTTDTLQGAFGGWALSLPTLGIPSPGPGHLGARAMFDASSVGQDFLYRMAVPGHEELNSMFTTLDMRDNSVRNVRELQFEHHAFGDTAACGDTEQEGRVFLDADQGLYLCRNGQAELIADTGNSRLFKDALLVADGDLLDKPSCAPGTNTEPEIFVAPSIFSANEKSPPLAAVQAWATEENDTQWRIHMRVLKGDGKGWVYPDANYGRAMAFALCTRRDTDAGD